MTTKSLIERNTGRTARLIVYYVDTLLKNPNRSIGIFDHTNKINPDMVSKVKEILTLLNVQFTVYENIINVLPIGKTK